jgi:hypothetical protein
MTGVWWPCATYIGVFILWTTEQWAQINIDHSGDQRWPGLFSLNGWSANTGYCFIKAVCDCVTFIILMRSTQSGYLLFFAGVHSAAWTVTIFYDPWLYCYSQHLICYTPYFLILTPLCTFRLLQMLLFTIIPAPWTPLIQFWRRARSMI